MKTETTITTDYIPEKEWVALEELEGVIELLKKSCKHSFENWEYNLFCKKIDKAFEVEK